MEWKIIYDQQQEMDEQMREALGKEIAMHMSKINACIKKISDESLEKVTDRLTGIESKLDRIEKDHIQITNDYTIAKKTADKILKANVKLTKNNEPLNEKLKLAEQRALKSAQRVALCSRPMKHGNHALIYCNLLINKLICSKHKMKVVVRWGDSLHISAVKYCFKRIFSVYPQVWQIPIKKTVITWLAFLNFIVNILSFHRHVNDTGCGDMQTVPNISLNFFCCSGS